VRKTWKVDVTVKNKAAAAPVCASADARNAKIAMAI